MNKLIIIDGYSMLFRAFFATYNEDKNKLMHSSNGTPTNAIYAFSNMLFSIMKNFDQTDGLVVALDSSKQTFRHLSYPGYKATRKPLPEELKVQFPIFRELLNALNIFYYENPTLEADDIAGNIAKHMAKEGFNVEIYTSDKDYLQLIDDNITIELIKQGLKNIDVMTPTSFKETYGFEPIKIIDYKGLVGDVSDNLPGIPGIGERTATKLIQQFGGFENIIKNANVKTKTGQAIIKYQEDGRLSYKLAKIKLDDELNINKDDVIYKGYEQNKVDEFAKKYEFTHFSSRLPINLKQEGEKNFELNFEEIENIDSLNIKNYLSLAIDINQKENYHNAIIEGISITYENKNYYIKRENFIKDEKLLSILKDPNIKKYCYDFKKIKYVLNTINIEINGLYFDLLLADYLLNQTTTYDFFAMLHLNSINVNYNEEQLVGIDKNNDHLLTSIYSYFPYNLANKYINKLKSNNQYDLLMNVEQPLTIVLCEMEIEGFPLNKEVLEDFKKIYEEKANFYKKEVYSLAGEEFNLNSPKQLSTILFDKLGIHANRNRSTSYEHLSKLAEDNPIVNSILEYRRYSKIISTYIDGLIPFIDKNGLIHCAFNQALTSTGRLSCSEPNLQNISIRDEEGKNIRKAFYYKENNLNILSLDYSQIELRILAHLSDSKTLINAFNSDEDIHSLTAKKVFHLDREPTPEERRKAKAVNFGIVYGISDWGLSEQINCHVVEAREIIKNFYEEFPEIKEYLNSLITFAQCNGYTLTMFSRRRYLPNINSTDFKEREFEKRAAMNAPIQGSAADLIKIAMIKLRDALLENNFKAKIVNQIHDEIILKVDDNEKDQVLELAKNIMENCVKLKVKLKVSGGYAKDWYSAK